MEYGTIEYSSFDRFKDYEEKIESLDHLEKRLQEIKNEVSKWWNIIFSVDIVLKGIGHISIALDDKCILSFYDEIEDLYLTSLGDPSAEGKTLYYFGDTSLMSNKYIILPPCPL